MSSGTVSPSHLFEELLRQLGACHHTALQELEAKVMKLKKDRWLDAQKLEEFFNRNRQLKEQNTSLQDAVSHLEERLRAGECERCTSFKENPKKIQDQNLQIVTGLKSERNMLEDKNTMLLAEMKKMKMRSFDSSSELEDGVIPDSPILTSSLLTGSKLKKHKNKDKKKNVRYEEKPLPGFNKSLFNEVVCTTKKHEQDEVLVVNTCEEDASQVSKDVDGLAEEVIADTCAFDLLEKHPVKVEKTTSQQNSKLKSTAPGRTSTRIHSPDLATQRSPSLLPGVKRSLQGAEQKKQESNAEQIREAADMQKEDGQNCLVLRNRISEYVRNQGLKRKPLDDEEESGQSGTSSQDQPVSYLSPVFKKPDAAFKREAELVGRKRPIRENPNASHDQPAAKHAESMPPVEPMWSVDPALALSMYDSERTDEEAAEEELIDTDCTWVSHSLLQGRGQNSRGRGDRGSRLGQKANDSLEMMFDKTVDEEYKSFIGESQRCTDDDEEEEEEEEEEEMRKEKHAEQDPPEKSKAPAIPYPHIAVVRRKDERRKLKGTTCKECETYYSHLPEEERQKKLAGCSRHRFQYIPPCTPENFWEVGFPSTQTCMERGYIREEEKPQERRRRRRPFSAFFSPKNSLEQS